MRLLFLFIYISLSALTASADIKISGIYGYSKIQNYPSATNSNIIVLGGFAGDESACNTTATDSTCNNCTGDLNPCNETRAHNNLELQFKFASTTKFGIPKVTTQVSSGSSTSGQVALTLSSQSVSSTTGANQIVTVGVHWQTVCNRFPNPDTSSSTSPECSELDGSTQSFLFGIDGDSDGFLNGTNDDYATVSVVIANGSGYSTQITDSSEIATCKTSGQGLCDFSLFPGDEKAYVENPTIKSGARQITTVHFYCDPGTDPSDTDEHFPESTNTVVYASLPANNGTLTQSIFTGLTNGMTYSCIGSVEDNAGNIGHFFKAGNEGCPSENLKCRQVTPDAVIGLFNKQQNCFIATAAYGSPIEPQVQTLRSFRDRYLRPHFLGQLFIRTYYTLSPYLAQWISESPTRRLVARWTLTPLVLSVSFMMNYPLLTLAMLLVIFALAILQLKQRERKVLSQRMRR